jgi:hypothetical protein
MTPHPQRGETQIKIEDGILKIPLPFVFGYFPRNKYKDLVFYIKSGEHSNCGLFEMEDTVENREMMDALASHSNQQSERDYQNDDCIWMTPEEEERCIRKHERDKVLDEIQKGESLTSYTWRKAESLRKQGEL